MVPVYSEHGQTNVEVGILEVHTPAQDQHMRSVHGQFSGFFCATVTAVTSGIILLLLAFER